MKQNACDSKECFVLTLKCRPSDEDRMLMDRLFDRATDLYHELFDRTLNVFKGLMGVTTQDEDGKDSASRKTEFRRCWDYGWQARKAARLEYAIGKSDNRDKIDEMRKELDPIKAEMAETRKLFPDVDDNKVYSACYKRCIETLLGTVINGPEQMAGYKPATFSQFGFVGLCGAIVATHEFDFGIGSDNGLNTAISSPIAENLWRAWNTKLKFSNFGKNIMIRRKDRLSSLKFKNNSGLAVDVGNRSILVRSKNNGAPEVFSIPFRVNRKDEYAVEALDGAEPVHTTFKLSQMGPTLDLYVQFCIYGRPPSKGERLGKGRVGIHLGASSVTVVTKDRVERYDLARTKDLDDEIDSLQARMDVVDRKSNPDNYNEDGTPKKGAKNVHTDEYMRLKSRLSNLHRRVVEHRKNQHGWLVNRIIIPAGDVFVTTKADILGWQDGEASYGASKCIHDSAPSEFIERLKAKVGRCGGTVIVHPVSICVAQYDPTDRSFSRKEGEDGVVALSDGTRVDAKALSAYNVLHSVDEPRPEKLAENFSGTDRDFRAFVKAQSKIGSAVVK